MNDDITLPPELIARIQKERREGISYSIVRGEEDNVTCIHWHPGDPNALAEAIITEVHAPMQLDLHGHHYTITPA